MKKSEVQITTHNASFKCQRKVIIYLLNIKKQKFCPGHQAEKRVIPSTAEKINKVNFSHLYFDVGTALLPAIAYDYAATYGIKYDLPTVSTSGSV